MKIMEMVWTLWSETANRIFIRGTLTTTLIMTKSSRISDDKFEIQKQMKYVTCNSIPHKKRFYTTSTIYCFKYVEHAAKAEAYML